MSTEAYRKLLEIRAARQPVTIMGRPGVYALTKLSLLEGEFIATFERVEVV